MMEFRMKQILFLSQVFPKVKCYCNDDDETLYNVLEGSIDTEELHGYFQKLEHQHTDEDTGDLTNTTVGGLHRRWYKLRLPPARSPVLHLRLRRRPLLRT